MGLSLTLKKRMKFFHFQMILEMRYLRCADRHAKICMSLGVLERDCNHSDIFFLSSLEIMSQNGTRIFRDRLFIFLFGKLLSVSRDATDTSLG